MATKEVAIEPVKMLDGRIVDFPGKRKLQKESFVDPTGKVTVRLDFRNGESRQIVLRNDMLTKYAAHGAEQKLGDECAGVDEVDDMVLAVDDLIGRLDAGEWSMRREGAGISGTSILLRAIVEVTGKPLERVKEYLKGKSQTEKMALRESAKFRDVVKRLEAERDAKKTKVDVAPLEAELDAI